VDPEDYYPWNWQGPPARPTPPVLSKVDVDQMLCQAFGQSANGFRPTMVKMIPLTAEDWEEKETTRVERIEIIEKKVKELEAELARLKRFPDGDALPDGTVWSFIKEYRYDRHNRVYLGSDGVATMREFTYVALKADGLWWVTGQNKHSLNGASYEKLVEFIGKSEVFSWTKGDKVA
jgi:hypothetical protein